MFCAKANKGRPTNRLVFEDKYSLLRLPDSLFRKKFRYAEIWVTLVSVLGVLEIELQIDLACYSAAEFRVNYFAIAICIIFLQINERD